MSPSPLQLLIVGAIVILLFGARRFSDLGKGLGEGIRNFKKGVAEEDSDDAKKSSAKPGVDDSGKGGGKSDGRSDDKSSTSSDA